MIFVFTYGGTGEKDHSPVIYATKVLLERETLGITIEYIQVSF